MELPDLPSLQQALDGLDPLAAPRVQLTYPCSDAAPAVSSVAVLDSSFNPPTRAHLHLLDMATERFGLERKLLLLAKVNADKALQGATLPQRLQMMQLIAQADASGSTLCGLTAHPLFVDKATALTSFCREGARVLLLVGFDTWVRITDPKYYAEGQLPQVLERIFKAVEVAVASRDPASASATAGSPLSIEEQEAAVTSLPQELSRGRLHFLRNDEAMSSLASSTVRKALVAEDAETAHTIVPGCLHAYIEESRLYRG
uniref:Cytidyltransferase-like domain-containing protein n=1 Tax=Alexandrium catenella TaxID=2925 RepID=A0A7S1QFS7_ALECA